MKEGELYFDIRERLEPYYHILDKAIDAVFDQDVSNYPIFIIHNGTTSLGINVVHDDELAINLSTLEEFSTKSIISQEKLDAFLKVYKSAEDYYCVLEAQSDNPSFVFIPRRKVEPDPAKSN